VYEILFLSKERELDTQIVDQLDRERSQAELQALTNEMDPHFIFNSLNTLNHLIMHEPLQAHAFNNRLAQVYKYFLINKTKELIPLKDELEFIESYFYLLQTRHDDKLQLHTVLSSRSHYVLIPPCSLQILVENAIKHNEFTEENPLQIKVSANDHFLYVSNNVKPKPYAVNSTGIGLKNLNARYRILFQKDIHIERTRENFTVKLPLIT
jgi:LytS/YehU family sensor histidine kinase